MTDREEVVSHFKRQRDKYLRSLRSPMRSQDPQGDAGWVDFYTDLIARFSHV